MTPRRGALVAASALTLLLLAGCTAGPGGQAAPTTTAAPSAASATPTAAADPTCETLIRSDVVDSLTSHEWTARAEPFRIGSVEVPGGLWCQWGDYSVASDHVQIYGWARIDASAAAAARAALLKEGWHEVEGGFITQSADASFSPDADGFGMTYQFGDGWVTVADTKQGLLVIQRPGA